MTSNAIPKPCMKKLPKYGRSRMVLCGSAKDLGFLAAGCVARAILRLLKSEEEIRIVFAAAESQVPFLDALAEMPEIPWERIVCFNMDDLWSPGLPESCSCSRIAWERLYGKTRPKAVHTLDFRASNPELEAERFERALRQSAPLHITCQGIGRSGHIALNEPDACDFKDSRWVRVAELSAISRQQLAEDPNFYGVEDIPSKGISMTLPALLSSQHIFTMAPLASKKPILTKLIETSCPTPALPASILSAVEGVIFIDRESCPESLLPPTPEPLKFKGAKSNEKMK